MNAMKQLGNEFYTASHLSRTNVESAHETSLVQFKKQQDQWTQGMQCFWCWNLDHKAPDCPRRAAGDSRLPNPGSNSNTNNNNTSNGENDNNNNNGGSGKTKCGRCNGHHATESCFHDPAYASKRPDNWIVKKEFSTVAVGTARKN
jgi:hypothetical protein